MPRSRVHSLNILGFRHYETHLGSHNSRAKGVLERRPVMIYSVGGLGFSLDFKIDPE